MGKKHRGPRLRSERQIAEVYARNGHLPSAVIERMLIDGHQNLSDQNDAYKAGLDASDPNNRFMRYRVGLGGSGDAGMQYVRLWYVRETSRHMAQNDDLIGQAYMRLADNIVQDSGFRLVSQTGEINLDADIEAMSAEWGADPSQCDYFGERTWAQMQWIVQYQTEQDGEIFGLPIDNGTVQLIEAERCLTYEGQNRDNYLGLEFTEDGRIVAYNFTQKPLGPFQTHQAGPTDRYARWDADGLLNVYHIHDNRRVTQHRGLPWLTAAMIKCGMLDDLQFAMLVKAQSCAAHAAVIERTENVMGKAPNLGQRATTTTPASDGTPVNVPSDALKYGSTIALPYGFKLSGFTPSVPNAEFMQHVRETQRQIGANLSMPIEMILLDASSTNYSGWRGAMDQARMSFRRWQNQLSCQLLQPQHKFNVRRWAPRLGAVAQALLKTGDLYSHKWVPPAWPYVNPLDDANAGKVLMESGQASPRGLASARGDNYDEIIDETIEDRSNAILKAIEKAEAIESKTGWVVDPMIILGWDLPGNSALISQVDAQANVAAGGTPSTAPAPVPGQAPAPKGTPNKKQPPAKPPAQGGHVAMMRRVRR